MGWFGAGLNRVWLAGAGLRLAAAQVLAQRGGQAGFAVRVGHARVAARGLGFGKGFSDIRDFGRQNASGLILRLLGRGVVWGCAARGVAVGTAALLP